MGWVVFVGAVSMMLGCQSLGRRRSQGDAIEAREMTRLGQEAMIQDRWQEAETRLQHAVELCPHDVAARRHYAQSLWQLERKDEAIEHLRQAVQMSGGDPNWNVELGEMLLEMGEVDEAEEFAMAALDVDPELAAAWELRGNVDLRRGDEDGALSNFHRARSLGSVRTSTLSAMGAIYERQQRPHRVLSIVQRLEETSGGEVDVETLKRKGLALRSVGRLSEAAGALALAHQRSPQDQGLLVLLADCQYAAGQTDAAAASLGLARSMGQLDSLGQTLTTRMQSEPVLR